MVNGLHYQTASGARLALEHEVQRQLPGELDQAVIAGFGDDEDGLNVRLDASSTYKLSLSKIQTRVVTLRIGIPSCLLISRTATAVSARHLVSLFPSASSSSN